MVCRWLKLPGEDLDALFAAILATLKTDGPTAVINKRTMAPAVPGIEGLPKGHDVIPVPFAIEYLEARGLDKAVRVLKETQWPKSKTEYLGSTEETGKCRDDFGVIVCETPRYAGGSRLQGHCR